jgi:hypothetical protein
MRPRSRRKSGGGGNRIQLPKPLVVDVCWQVPEVVTHAVTHLISGLDWRCFAAGSVDRVSKLHPHRRRGAEEGWVRQ